MSQLAYIQMAKSVSLHLQNQYWEKSGLIDQVLDWIAQHSYFQELVQKVSRG